MKFVPRVLEADLHLIGKLRADANLQWLYEGEYKGSGRPRKFGGKIDSVKYVHWKDYKSVTTDLIEIYQATTEESALQPLSDFSDR